MIVITRQSTDMDQTLNVQVAQFNKDAEVRHGGNDSLKLLANPVLQKLALEPGIHFPRRVIRAALGHGALLAQCGHRADVIGVNSLSFERTRPFDPFDMSALTPASNRCANRAVHQQIGVAANG